MRAPLVAVAAVLCAVATLHANSGSYSIDSRRLPLPGTGFQGDSGFEVVDWDDDGKLDVFIYDSGSVGGGWVYLNQGSLAKPRFGHAKFVAFNSTELDPQTIQHISARAFCDLNHDGFDDLILFDGQLRYCPNAGATRSGPFQWFLWPQPPAFFPGSARMISENTRYSTGPESNYWNKGIFARQVLTLAVVDWDGDGLDDLIICRTRAEAPGVQSLGGKEEWTNLGRLIAAIPKQKKPPQPSAATGALHEPLARGLYLYKNVGTKGRPMFDRGVEIVTPQGASIAAPNPVAMDVDGDGVLDIVSTETSYSSNAFRVDWPTASSVVWFRRLSAADPAHLEPAAALTDSANRPIKAGTLARFADMRGAGLRDLLVSDPGFGGTIRWYRNAARSPHQKIDLQPPVVLTALDFGHFDFMDQPLMVNWFGANSNDLIVHGVTDPHCKWGLRRTALYRNVAKDPGEIRYEFAGLLTFNGDPAMVPVSAEERPYDIYGSAVSFARDHSGAAHLMMSVGGKLYYFSDLAPDGLTFRRMQTAEIGVKDDRYRGWQDIDLQTEQPIKYIRIGDNRRGRGLLSDGLLHVVQFAAMAGGKNVATAESGVKAVRFNVTDGKTYPLDRAMNMFTPGNANTDDELRATTFGLNDDCLITLGDPAKVEKIRFLLSDRDPGWYNKIVPFTWQGETHRVGYEQGELWYQYKIEVSSDGAKWTTVADRTKTEVLYSHPVLVDWDDDGRLDVLLHFTSGDGIWPTTKGLRLYRNIGTDDEPRYAPPVDAVDDSGRVLTWPANWARPYSPQCGIAIVDLDGRGNRDIILEGYGDAQLIRFKNISAKNELRLAGEGAIMSGSTAFSAASGYWYFGFGDADGDGVLDLLESNSGQILFHRGAFFSRAIAASDEPGERGVIILRNGPAAEGSPVYAGNSGLTLDAQRQTATAIPQPPQLEIRAPLPHRQTQKVALLRFEDLPETPVRSAVLELSTDPVLQGEQVAVAQAPALRASCSAIGSLWNPQSATYIDAADGQPWPEHFLETGGTFQSVIDLDLDRQHAQQFRWDVTQAVREAQERGRNSLDLLIRIEGRAAGQGLRVCGPGWPVVDERPKLILTAATAAH